MKSIDFLNDRIELLNHIVSYVSSCHLKGIGRVFPFGMQAELSGVVLPSLGLHCSKEPVAICKGEAGIVGSRINGL